MDNQLSQDATPQEFADLEKELAILEKQSRERYQKMIQDLEAALQYGRDSINEMAKQISQQNDLIVSLEATIDQDQQTKEELRQQLIVFKDECNRNTPQEGEENDCPSCNGWGHKMYGGNSGECDVCGGTGEAKKGERLR